MIKLPTGASSDLHWLILAAAALAVFLVAKAASGAVKIILWVAFFAGMVLLAQYLLK